MKKLISILIALMLLTPMSGCLTVQLKGDDETLAAPSLIMGLAGAIIKVKYPAESKKLLAICDKIINTDVNKEIESNFNALLQSLTNEIKDEKVKIYAQAILNSFDVKVDSGIDYDFGARRMVVELAKTLKGVLGG